MSDGSSVSGCHERRRFGWKVRHDLFVKEINGAGGGRNTGAPRTLETREDERKR